MKVVMLTYTHTDRAADFEAVPEADQKAWIDQHMAWFEKHSDVIAGGTEMAWPQRFTSITKADGSAVCTDGPFAETKEILGGSVELDVQSFDQATAIAAEWPNIQLEATASSSWRPRLAGYDRPTVRRLLALANLPDVLSRVVVGPIGRGEKPDLVARCR